jgi:acyl-CoA synthetase (AMP-forming)/AMP-acid ligase II
MINHPDAVALFFALSSLPLPVVVLPADVRAWPSVPPVPTETPVFLPPQLHGLAGAGQALGLQTFAMSDARLPATTTRAVPFMATPGIVVFTSGSTGPPKPVYFLTRNLFLQLVAIAETCRLSRGAAIAGGLPLATPFGLVRNLLMAAFLGSTLGLLERFDHRSALKLFAAAPYAHWVGTPLMADMLTRAAVSVLPRPSVPPSCHIGTGKLPERVFRAFLERFGVPLRPAYGLAEGGAVTVDMGRDDEIRPASVGRPVAGVEVRIGDDPLDPTPPGRPGRVWVRSPWYMEGYGFPPTLAPRESRGGWRPTQDIGILDEAGYLILTGRVDDCFKTSSGHLVNPGEITNALMSHPGVTDVVIMPVDGGVASVVIGALVEGDRALAPDALRAAAGRMLPQWLRPHVMAVTERLPRLPGGKADRAACRAILRFASGETTATRSAGTDR